jgi:hypothetical protein
MVVRRQEPVKLKILTVNAPGGIGTIVCGVGTPRLFPWLLR